MLYYYYRFVGPLHDAALVVEVAQPLDGLITIIIIIIITTIAIIVIVIYYNVTTSSLLLLLLVITIVIMITGRPRRPSP